VYGAPAEYGEGESVCTVCVCTVCVRCGGSCRCVCVVVAATCPGTRDGALGAHVAYGGGEVCLREAEGVGGEVGGAVGEGLDEACEGGRGGRGDEACEEHAGK
jgi:hypothetical protein